MQLSDKDMLTDLLLGTKSISTAYHHGVLEAANNRTRNTFIQLNNEELNFQKQIFDIMHDRNWYQVEPARMTATPQPQQRNVAPQQMNVREDYQMEPRPY